MRANLNHHHNRHADHTLRRSVVFIYIAMHACARCNVRKCGRNRYAEIERAANKYARDIRHRRRRNKRRFHWHNLWEPPPGDTLIFLANIAPQLGRQLDGWRLIVTRHVRRRRRRRSINSIYANPKRSSARLVNCGHRACMHNMCSNAHTQTHTHAIKVLHNMFAVRHARNLHRQRLSSSSVPDVGQWRVISMHVAHDVRR